jgi:Phage tail tube protein, GTA-gp10
VSADGSVTLTWAGEERRFRLAIGQLRELQENINRNRATPIGPMSLYLLISKGDAWPDDLREVIRLGLIGGGTRLELVPGLLKRYAEDRPLLELVPVAQAVLGVALMGEPDDPVGKKPQEAATATATASAFPTSTEAAQRWDLPRDKSMNAASGNSQPASRGSTEPTAQRNNRPR